MQFKYLFLSAIALLTLPFPISAQENHILFTHGGSVQTVAYSSVNSSLIASAGDNNTIKLWDLQNDTVLTFRGHTGQINSVAFSPDGQLLASGGRDWTFRLWNVHTQQHIATLEHIADQVLSSIEEVVFSPDGQTLASAGYLGIKLWDINDQAETATLEHDDWVWTVVFSPNGQLLATGDAKGTVRVWDIEKRDVIARLEGDTQSVYSVVFSPDGRTLASSGIEGQIKLWAVSDWTLLGTLQNRGTAFAVDFSPDGKALVSTGHAAVTLWSVESGEEIASLTGHSGWVKGAAFSPDGKSVASGGDDGTVCVQNIESYLQTLQQREMVRLIYFLPRNRIAQQNIDTQLDTLIKDVQQFYAEQMHNHGFGRKTFTCETDAMGKAVVYYMKGRFSDAYYREETVDKIIEEVEERFDLSKNIYLIFIDTSSERIDDQWCGKGGIHGTTGGKAVVPASGVCFIEDQGIETASHELGHAFGLDHDFRNGAYIMSYGLSNEKQLSSCAAEWLDAHRYFNTHQTSFNEPATITMYTPLGLPHDEILFRFEAADTDGLHQAQFIIPVAVGDPADGVKLHSCQALHGEINRIEFTTTELTTGGATEVILRVIDVHGNFMQETYPISANEVAYVDVNSDDVVNVDDLVLVASHFGTAIVRGADPNPDVNNDGVVNREDLLLVVEALESQESMPAAPTFIADNLQRWIFEAKRHNYRDTALQSGIAVLEQLLMQFHPTETALLPNYPNPFNPETWIPYQLAAPSDVSLSIYAVNGQIVRQLALGHQPAGVYQSQSKAVYWDGRNEQGERVASGVYFYTLSVGDFTATRKMLIRK